MSEDAPHDVAAIAVADADVFVDEEPTNERQPPRRRSTTLSVKRLTRMELAIGQLLWPERIVDRPQTRADCANVPRPCPYVGCRHHLYLDAKPTGNLVLNYPELEPWQIEVSCSLDVADAGDHTLEYVAERLALTRERIRQIELRAAAKCRRTIERLDLDAPDREHFASRVAIPLPRQRQLTEKKPRRAFVMGPRGATYPGRPCKRGHLDAAGRTVRYRNGGACVQCMRAKYPQRAKL